MTWLTGIALTAAFGFAYLAMRYTVTDHDMEGY